MIHKKCSGCRQLSPEKQAIYNEALIAAYEVSRKLGNASPEARALGSEAKKILGSGIASVSVGDKSNS